MRLAEGRCADDKIAARRRCAVTWPSHRRARSRPPCSIAAAAAAQALDFAGRRRRGHRRRQSGEIPGVVVLVGRGDDDPLLPRRAARARVVPDPLPDDARHDLRHRLAHQAVRHDAGGDVAGRAWRRSSSTRRSGATSRSSAARPSSQVTIRRLLTHSAGFAAIPTTGAVDGGFPTAARALAAKLPLDYPPGTGFQYSDTGLHPARRGRPSRERRAARSVSRSTTIFEPLGLTRHDVPPAGAVRDRIAPTEFAQRPDAASARSTTPARVRSAAWPGTPACSRRRPTSRASAACCWRRAALDGRRILQPATVRSCGRALADGNGSRALGWDVSLARTRARWRRSFPPASVGHTGFTGTSVWIDPADAARYLIVLTNRVHPSGGGAGKHPRAAHAGGGRGRRRALPAARCTRSARRTSTAPASRPPTPGRRAAAAADARRRGSHRARRAGRAELRAAGGLRRSGSSPTRRGSTPAAAAPSTCWRRRRT